jgi:hypothetical protein
MRKWYTIDAYPILKRPIGAFEVFIPPSAVAEFYFSMNAARRGILQHDFAFGITPDTKRLTELIVLCGGGVALNTYGDLWGCFLRLPGGQLCVHALPVSCDDFDLMMMQACGGNKDTACRWQYTNSAISFHNALRFQIFHNSERKIFRWTALYACSSLRTLVQQVLF